MLFESTLRYEFPEAFVLASMLRPDTPSALLLPEVSLALVLTPLVDDAMSRLVVPVAEDEPGV